MTDKLQKSKITQLQNLLLRSQINMYCSRSNVHEALGIQDLKRSDQVPLETLLQLESIESFEVRKFFSLGTQGLLSIIADQ